MKNNVKVSIVVPAYNIRSYLERCLDSLVEQTFRDIEIIVVNDGSTDSSKEFLDTYAKEYNYINVIHQKNKGLGAARNRGIYESIGEYILFVDGDDYVDSTIVEKLYSEALQSNVEIVSCRYARVDEEVSIKYLSPIIQSQDAREYLHDCLTMKHSLTVWNKLYKREIFTKDALVFENALYHEDILFTCQLAIRYYSIKHLDDVLYYWVERDRSISSSITEKHIKDRLEILQKIKQNLYENSLYQEYKDVFMAGCLQTVLYFLDLRSDTKATDLELLNAILEFVELPLIKEKYPQLYVKYLALEQHQKRKDMPQDFYKDELIDISSTNYDFSKKLNRLYSNIKLYKAKELKIALYGNGLATQIIAPLLQAQLVVIADQNTHQNSLYAPIVHPSDLQNYTFDILLITVLGREIEIQDDLIENYGIAQEKIEFINLVADHHLAMPIKQEETTKLKNLKDKYRAKRCFIIGNGPSLNKCDLKLLENEYTFGVNGIFYKTDEMGFKPTFYMVEDNHVIHDNIKRINQYDCKYKFFPSIYRDRIIVSSNTYFFTADMGFYNENHPFFCRPRFSYDFSKQAYTGQSVTYMQIQLAYYLGFTEVYLIGMDYNYDVPKTTKIQGVTYESQEDDPNHFHPDYFGKGKKWHDPKLERVALNYEKAKEVFAQENRVLKNATIGGKLEIFERVDYNSLF